MKNFLYKLFIRHATDCCYKNCLQYFPAESTVLDVGIGNGIMLTNYHGLIKSKQLQITGVDSNKSYLKHCSSLVDRYGLDSYISVYHDRIEAYEPPASEWFDFILFSMSFMLFKDQKTVLNRIKDWLKPNGEIIFFQTIYSERFRFMEFVKPKLKYVTTVDFGKITYENDFFILLKDHKLPVLENRTIKKKWFRGEYRMIVAAVNENKKCYHTDLDNSEIHAQGDTTQ